MSTFITNIYIGANKDTPARRWCCICKVELRGSNPNPTCHTCWQHAWSAFVAASAATAASTAEAAAASIPAAAVIPTGGIAAPVIAVSVAPAADVAM